MKIYHGTNAIFDKFEESKARVANDFWGGGVAYLATDKMTALTYAKSMVRVKKTGFPVVYTLNFSARRIFDVDHVFTGKELVDLLPTDIEGFARGAGILKFGTDKFSVLRKLKAGDWYMTGEEVFKGLSRGMSQTAKAREHLKSKGFDGLRYNAIAAAGVRPHDVYIAYYSNQLKIVKKERAMSRDEARAAREAA